VWSDRLDRYATSDEASAPAPAPAAAPQASEQDSATHPPLLGRSIYYGALIYLPAWLTGHELPSVLVQAGLIAVTLWLLVAMLFPARDDIGRSRRYLAIVLAMAVLTPAAYSASLLMPDFLTGTAILAFGMLLLFWTVLGRWARCFLGGVVVLAAMAHSSNLPLIAGFILLGIGLRLAGARITWPPILLGLSALVAGIGGEAAFSAAVTRQTGVQPIRPPFLTARLLASGPGYDYAVGHCTTSGFEVCRYLDRLPHDSDIFLWSQDDRDGVFSASDHRSQRLLAAQDGAFALATLRAYPLQTMQASLIDFAAQLTMFDMRSWRQAGQADITAEERWSALPAPVARRMAATRASNEAMPVEPVQTLTVLGVCAALVALLLMIAATGSVQRLMGSRWLTFGLFVACALMGNAFITGALSKPDPRYNLRAVWALPLVVAAAALAGEGRRHRRGRPPLLPDFSGAS
jgi:hypothetical protein